jgi:hypothetical protein
MLAHAGLRDVALHVAINAHLERLLARTRSLVHDSLEVPLPRLAQRKAGFVAGENASARQEEDRERGNTGKRMAHEFTF